MNQLKPFGIKKSALEREFERFHANNPAVYDELRKLAFQAKQAGAKRIGMRMLWEVMRWNTQTYIQTVDEVDTFRLNDHYPPYYARLLMQKEPELRGLFETRRVNKL